MHKIFKKFLVTTIFLFILGEKIFSYPQITAQSSILVDAQTGKILYAKDEHQRMHPASTTKILTAILLLEKGNMQDTVKVSKNASERKADESSIWLAEGEKVTVENLVYAILLRSANDACVVVAEYISGDEKKFISLMNKYVKKLGAKNTNFANPHGMTEENHYTTAYDLSQISRYAVKNTTFCKIVQTRKRQIPWEGKQWDRVLINKNKLLRKYPYCDGIKTGYTREAGHCLVASATKDGWKLISVVLKSKNIYDDTIALFEYGFNNFKPQVLMDKNYIVKTKKFLTGKPKELKIVTSEKSMIIIPKKENDIQAKAYLQLNKTKLPIKKGDIVGKVIFRDESNKEIASVLAIAQNDVNKNYFLIISFYIMIAIILTITYNKIRLNKIKQAKKKARSNYV